LFDIFVDFFLDLIIFLPRYFQKRRDRRKEWSGTAVRKKTVPTLSSNRFSVIFKTDQGRTKRVRMKEADFDRFQEGRAYRKRAGADLPDPL
jgi:hypothetical protein